MSTPAPYPPDTRAKGWRFEIDHERIRQSDTWALAPAEVRPWFLMLWMVAWEQTPCGSLPDDDALIAARIGMPPKLFAKHRDLLMRGWTRADDGRLYHHVLTERVLEMVEKRRKDALRRAGHRGVTQMSRVTSSDSSVTDDTKHQAPEPVSEGDKPLRKSAPKRAVPPHVGIEELMAEGFDAKTAAEFIAHKAGLKAPLTPRAWADHLREAARAGWTAVAAAEKVMAKGWKGFEAKYVANEQQPAPRFSVPPAETPYQRQQRERMTAFAPGVAARAPSPQQEAIDVLATRVD